jgi:ribosomal 50S subunit-associated protein YjgA (DUF615 family)
MSRRKQLKLLKNDLIDFIEHVRQNHYYHNKYNQERSTFDVPDTDKALKSFLKNYPEAFTNLKNMS